MAENIKNTVSEHVSKDTANWISQINAGNVTYDIATHHSITFKDGKGDTKGIEWNGLSDLEIVIPSITDIVQTPIEFAGTVGADGKISWNTGHGEPAEVGNLLFVTADCTFAGHACEAGDMAIYAGDGEGEGWKIVSGENQVKIVGATQSDITTDNRTVVAVGAAKDVLVVEGKALSLTLDYAELDTHVSTKTGDKVDVVFAKAPEVKSEYIKLAYTAASEREIATEVSFENATALKDGKVTFTNDTFVTGVNFGEFNAGSLATYKKNGSIDFAVAPGSLSEVNPGSDFVTSVSLPAVYFDKANDGDTNVITAITGISAIAGTQSFLTDIHLTDVEKGETANLTIGGYLAPNAGKDATFVTGLADNKTSVITDIVAGEFKIVEGGNDFVTGLDTAATEVVTAVSVTANNDTSVLNEAKVENHVLSFGSTNVTSGVTATPTTAKFTKAGVSYTKTTFTSTSLLSDGFTMTSDVKYTFGSAKETVCDYDTYSWKVVTPELSIEKGMYTIADGGKVTIAADTFLTGVEKEAVLPTWTNASFSTGKVEGSVATALTTETKTINALAEGVTSIATPGTYSLTTVAAAEEGTIAVGKVGALDNMTATVDLTNYLTDVTIVTDVPKTE
jgi:hypothetical protein